MISNTYRAQLREAHSKDERWGTSARKHKANVERLISAIGAKCLIDYGCGKGELARVLEETIHSRGLFLCEYDPGIEGKDSRPAGSYDLLVCLDVMEHLEEQYLQDVMEHFKDLIGKLGFFVISNRYAKAVLPDGRNAHLIVKGPDWWESVFQTYFDRVVMKQNGVRSETYILVAGDDYDGEMPEFRADIK